MDVQVLLWLASGAVLASAFVSNETKAFYETVLQNAANPYDRRIRPFAGERPLDVEIFLRVLSIRSVSEITMDYKIELYFREVWRDPRLAYDPLMYKNMSHISLHESVAEELWTPDTYFPNAIKSKSPNSGSVTHRSLIRVDPDGRILYSRRLSVKAECPMNLASYPFDRQVCGLSIESYGHAVTEVTYHWWKASPVIIDPRLELPEFKLTNTKAKERNVTLLTGTYTRLECCFFFKRNAGFYFIQLFLPATAIVVMSWLLLYMERTSKFSDMIEVILAITLLYYSYITVMPRVSYIKAMDIYLGSCFVFVFISLIKLYALKLNRWRRPQDPGMCAAAVPSLANPEEEDEDGEENLEDYTQDGPKVSSDLDEKTQTALAPYRPAEVQRVNETLMDGCNNERAKKTRRMRRLPSWIRYGTEGIQTVYQILATSMAVYPMVFVCFSILYFAYFLVLAKDDSEQKCEFPVT